MSGLISTANVNASRPSSASPTMSKSGSRLQDLAHADAEQRVIVDEQDLGLRPWFAAIRSAAAAVWTRVIGVRHFELLYLGSIV